MMRRLALIPILALAACSGENSGWNPNYRAHASPYGNYLRAREVALVSDTLPPKVIPVALPARAPTPEEIAGPRQYRVVPNAKPRGAPAIDPGIRVVPGATVVRETAPIAAPVTGTATTPLLSRYAAASPHAFGTRVWVRSPPTSPTACTSFASAAAAQTTFLLRGGPAVDPLGLDADGDGFACGWAPAQARGIAPL